MVKMTSGFVLCCIGFQSDTVVSESFHLGLRLIDQKHSCVSLWDLAGW